MKRINILMLVCIMTTGLVMAQPSQRGERRQADPKARAEKRTERMVTEYGLNDTQKARLLELNLAVTENMGDRPGNLQRGKRGHRAKAVSCCCGADATCPNKPEANKEEREKRIAEAKQARETYENKLKEIFTEEQYKKHQANLAERQPRRGDFHKGRKDKRKV